MTDAYPARRAALFVDFDNIYLALRDADRRAAESFAQQPDRWLSWFAKGLHEEQPAHGGDSPGRSILVRRCYLNPHSFGAFRPYFTRAGFSVIDCPALTGRGKNSADIVMVMDLLDALEHKTRFDEFIILSGDADFTPVLLRLRAHDRRTVVVTNALTAAAYRAAADISVNQDDFIEEALGVDAAESRGHPAKTGELPPLTSLEAIADASVEYLRQHGRVQPNDLIAVFRRNPSFTADSKWLGSGTLRKLCEKLAELRPQLTIEGSEQSAWTIGLASATAAPSEADQLERRAKVLEHVRNLLAASDRPIDAAYLGKVLISDLKVNFKETDWEGAGSLRELLQSADDPHIVVHNAGGGSVLVYDPERHSLREPSPEQAPQFPRQPELPAPLSELAQKVSHVTGCPRLHPDDYRFLFGLIAEYPFAPDTNPNQVSAVLRDKCREQGHSISRSNISFVLTAFRFRRYDLTAPGKSAAQLAAVFKRNVVDLCANASLPLSDADVTLLDEWVGSPPQMSGDEVSGVKVSGVRVSGATPPESARPADAAWQQGAPADNHALLPSPWIDVAPPSAPSDPPGQENERPATS